MIVWFLPQPTSASALAAFAVCL